MKFEIGAQLYTVRDFCKTISDFDKSMSKIAKIGYKSVQISGTGDFTAQEMREISDKYGITIASTHIDPEKIKEKTQEVINDHKIMGSEYIGIGMMPREYMGSAQGVARFVKDYTPAAKEIAAAGMKLMYHNHSMEFEKYGGKSVFDMLIEGFDKSLVGFTVDVYWITHGGGDPAFWLKKLSGRIETIHYKDMKIQDGQQRMGEVLEGNLNWEAIIAASEENGVKWVFVEQDDCYGKDPFDCLETSLKNLTKYSKNRP